MCTAIPGRNSRRNPAELVDALVALVLLFLSSPLLLLSALLVKLAHGGKVVWSGQRMGLRRQPFRMFKIHTLNDRAESTLGERELSDLTASSLDLELRFGHFLRETHLDELPQLYNVIRGDMRIIGPRPIRREVYESLCRSIPQFDSRFEVKPGVIGYSQVLATHNTDKRIAKKLDNRFIRNPPHPGKQAAFIIWVMIALCVKLLVKTLRLIDRPGRPERRSLRRVRGRDVVVTIGGSEALCGRLLDLSDRSMAISTERELGEGELEINLQTQYFDWSVLRRKKRSAHCLARISTQRPASDDDHAYTYVLGYEPTSALNHYKIEKYFLGRSVF